MQNMRVLMMAGLIGAIALSACSKSEGTSEVAAGTCGPSPSAAVVSDNPAQTKVKPSDVAAADNLGEVVGQMSWHLCNARANGWIDDAYYRSESASLRQAIFTKLGVAASPAAAPAKAPDTMTAESSDELRQEACLKAAGTSASAIQLCK
jgi:hypothetical protein